MNRKRWAALGTVAFVIAFACSSPGGSGSGDKFIDDCHDNGGKIVSSTNATSDIEKCMKDGKQIGIRVKAKNAPGNQWG